MRMFEDETRCAIIKKLLILLAVIILFFSAINGIWYFGYRQRYSAMENKLEVSYLYGVNDDKNMLRYTKEIDDYTISMKLPEYLGSGGFVSIAKTSGYEANLDDEGNIVEASDLCITLYVWPKYFSDYKLGLDFYDEANSVWEQVELTSKMKIMDEDNLDDAYIDNILELISENKDEINKLICVINENLDINIAELE